MFAYLLLIVDIWFVTIASECAAYYSMTFFPFHLEFSSIEYFRNDLEMFLVTIINFQSKKCRPTKMIINSLIVRACEIEYHFRAKIPSYYTPLSNSTVSDPNCQINDDTELTLYLISIVILMVQ